MSKVGFIGLGRMGRGMAGRYLDAGHDLVVWNRTEDKAADLLARGAKWASSPADVARDADAIVTMVADDEASRDVWLGPQGASQNARPGAVAIECSTVSHTHALALSQALKAKGLVSIDCPVTGLPDAAANGQLTLLVGADAGDLEKARPFLTPIGLTIRHFGAVGNGTIYKLINNLMGAIQIAGLAEGLAIAEQAGLDMAIVRDAIASSAPASPTILRYAPRMIERNFANASFTAALRHKDARYAVMLAETLLKDVLVSQAAVASYARAAEFAPDDDEGRLIEVISQPKL